MTGIDVERLDAVYLIPDDHPSPETLRWRLDRAARTRLEADFARALDGLVDEADESVWLVRELEVELAVDAGDDDEGRIAAAWARALADAVAEALAHGPDGERIRRFSNRADYVAEFVVDIVRGRAWDTWYYEPFASLRALPRGAAIREALGRDPPVGWGALVLLASRARLELVLGALGAADARTLADALAPPRAVTPAAVEEILAAWAAVVPAPEGTVATPANVLRVLMRIGPTRREPAALGGAARALLSFADTLRGDGADVPSVLRGDAADAAALVRAAEQSSAAMPLLAELRRYDPELVARIVETLAPKRPGTALATAFGGVFLLLPGLLELHLDRVLAPLRAEDDDPSGLRLEVLARCTGSAAALGDPGVRLAAGAAPSPAAADPNSAGDGLAQRLLLERLVRLGRAEGRFLIVDSLDGRFVLRDAARDAWLLVDEDPERALRIAREAFEREPEHVLAAGAAEAPAGFERWLERHADVRSEIAALSFGTEAAPDALLLAARATLRELAAKLMGFEWSSAAYLQENFIAGGGSVRSGEAGHEVELPASPLQVVLQLAGVHGQTLHAAWLGDTTLTLPSP